MFARLRARRRGVALPMAILLIGFITAGIIGAYGRMTGESRTLDAGRTTALAFALAESGLEHAAAAGQAADSVRYLFRGGFADVRVDTIRAVTDTTILLLRSTGTVNGGTALRPAARRAVAQLAVRRVATVDAEAAWTSLSGLRKNGGSGLISGVDECNPADTVPGAAVPGGMFELQSNGNKYPFDGTPPVFAEGTQEEFANAVDIDWGAIKAPPGAVSADVVVCRPGTDGYDPGWGGCASWPTFSEGEYPIILVNGSITLGSGDHGQGLLIVTGRLTFTGGQETWRGLILTGQELIDNGNGWVSGGVISGLDVKLGLDVPDSEIIEEAVANGQKEYRYNSCEIANALQGAAKMQLIPNAWIDNWSTW